MTMTMNDEKKEALRSMALHTGFNLPFALVRAVPIAEAVVYQFILSKAKHHTEMGWVPLSNEEMENQFPYDNWRDAIKGLHARGVIEYDKMLWQEDESSPMQKWPCYMIKKVISAEGWKDAEYK